MIIESINDRVKRIQEEREKNLTLEDKIERALEKFMYLYDIQIYIYDNAEDNSADKCRNLIRKEIKKLLHLIASIKEPKNIKTYSLPTGFTEEVMDVIDITTEDYYLYIYCKDNNYYVEVLRRKAVISIMINIEFEY